ncbi:hypothetical protein HYO65_gp047 [Tenacibaculum phage PTm1]|uniref:Uncharacterized protein n=2 Tax=Shirahamavirus PTm1 TaxID=2846435 RepID=A0A5S9BYZ7_9CAUD|nr:hypothetical protein HYO65_gp047 [Tenacibaculum phage PTm1]BBI90439.1 hypothetical protein [Tenacibaculum phage PTm1]BBI90746.1 hypothetical protein [Tenacibaculum phage PTm5]
MDKLKKGVKAPKLQRQTDKYVVFARELSSRGMSFWIALLGVILQTAHTTLLLYGVSAFTQEWQKILVSFGMGLFLSASLMIFTLKHKEGNKESEFTLNLFFWFEVFVGVFYYLNKLVFSVFRDGNVPQWTDYVYLLIGLVFAYMSPYAIKQFAYVIKSDATLEYGSIDDVLPSSVDVKVSSEENEKIISEKVEQIKEELTNSVLSKVDEKINSIELPSSVDGDVNNEELKVLKEDFSKLKNTTAKLLKDFKDDVDKVKGFNPNDYIKRGSKITMRTADGVRDVEVNTTEDK